MQSLLYKEGILYLAVIVGGTGVSQLNTLQQTEGAFLIALSAGLFAFRGVGKKRGWF